MTNEEKQLLLVDLCARLPYGVKIDEGYEGDLEEPPTLLTINHLYANDNYPIETIRPYLRPMSSMTKDEKKIYTEIGSHLCGEIVAKTMIDFLNKHMFDYRDMVGKGLALEAPEGMYTIKY